MQVPRGCWVENFAIFLFLFSPTSPNLLTLNKHWTDCGPTLLLINEFNVIFTGSENVLIFGGRSSSCLALGDCYLLNTKSKTWKKFAIRGDAAAPRHSHTACVWDNHVVLAGGLDAGLQALSIVQIMEIDVNSVKLRTLSVDPPLPPRYSHTAHVVDDNLVLIGGVTPISSHPPGVIVLHLKNLTWKSYTLPACLTPSIPLMLHNHCSVCWEDSQGIMVLGGGGNCFSFGTHFNDGPVFLDLSPLGEAVAFKCA